MAKDKGTFICYVPKKFNPKAMQIVGQADAIIQEYEAVGIPLTLRALYYQFVARDLFANSAANYNKLGTIISEARLAGLISWTAIEDITRRLRGLDFSESPADAIRHARAAYRIDLWAGQPFRPYVAIEKDAGINVIASVCNELRVDYFSCRGYGSQSMLWRMGKRFARDYQNGQRPIIFHLGDHDPSGLDMTRDNRERMSMFAGTDVMVVRLGLNYDQVQQYNPPPNPAKIDDPRARDYIERFGEESWELDALDPKVIAALIRDSVGRVRDAKMWSEALEQEASDLDSLDMMIDSMSPDEEG